MKRAWIRTRNYLLQPETGAGLLYAALAFGIARLWLIHIHRSMQEGADFAVVMQEMAGELFFAWTLVSFLLGAWLAFVFLRRRAGPRMMQRILLVAVVHALGALRFYEWGLLLLSILPLFAIAPALLLPPRR